MICPHCKKHFNTKIVLRSAATKALAAFEFDAVIGTKEILTKFPKLTKMQVHNSVVAMRRMGLWRLVSRGKYERIKC